MWIELSSVVFGFITYMILVGGFKYFIFHNIWDNPSHWLSYLSRRLLHHQPVIVHQKPLYFSIKLGMSLSQLTFIFFRGVGIPPTVFPSHHPSLHGIFHYKPSISSINRWGLKPPTRIWCYINYMEQAFKLYDMML